MVRDLLELIGEGFFQEAANCSPSCLQVLDLQGCVQFANAPGLAFMGRADLAEVRGKPWAPLWPDVVRGDVERAISAASRGERACFEAEAPTSQGITKQWSVTLSPLKGEGGVVAGLLAVSRDTTHAYLNRHESELRSRESVRAAAAIRSAKRLAQLGGWEYDCATRHVIFSSELLALIGGDGRALSLELDQSLTYWVEGDREAFAQQLEEAAAFGREFSFEGRFHAPDGSIRWMRITGEAEMSGGWCVALRGAAQDVTDWRESLDRLHESEQTALRATEAMSAFLTNMSHELRTPLNCILGMTQVLALEPLTEGQLAKLQLVKNSGEALLSLLNDLLDLSKIKAGAAELEIGLLDTLALARDAEGLAFLAREKGLDFGVSIAPGAVGEWPGDPKRVAQILHNLIGNAIKFTDAGSVTVEITEGKTGLVLAVRDTGIGIPVEQRTEIFERFVQADSSTTRRHGGSGLGLAICRDWVQLMGGEIAIESEVGVGTTFSIALPLERASARAEVLDAAPAPDAREALRVLAAEDNRANQIVLKNLLAAFDIDVVVVENGQLAVEAWRAGDWDVVLMDVQMPVMDGVSATRAIREIERREGRVRTPIVGVTANAMAHHRVEYLACGMDDVAPKPINLAMLMGTIERVLAAQEETQEDPGPSARAAGAMSPASSQRT